MFILDIVCRKTKTKTNKPTQSVLPRTEYKISERIKTEDHCSLEVFGVDGLRKYDIFVLVINNLGQSL